MPFMTISEKSRTRSYGLLSSRVSQTLTDANRIQRLLTQEEREIISDGLELLDKFIIGSRLVEGDDFKDGIRPTADSLRAYRYALTTLSTLEKLHEDEEASKILGDMRDQMLKILSANSTNAVGNDDLQTLQEFFTVLATSLCEDLVRLRFEKGSEDRSPYHHFTHTVGT